MGGEVNTTSSAGARTTGVRRGTVTGADGYGAGATGARDCEPEQP